MPLPLNALNLAYQEPTEEALERAKQAIESLNAQGVMLARTRYLARMGEVFWMAGRCAEGLAAIAEALALVERTGERVAEAEIWRIKGELLLKAAASNAQRGSGKLLSPGHRDRPAAEREIVGTARRNEPRALVAAAGQDCRSAADAGGDLRLVYRRLRHGGSERCQGVAGGIAH